MFVLHCRSRIKSASYISFVTITYWVVILNISRPFHLIIVAQLQQQRRRTKKLKFQCPI